MKFRLAMSVLALFCLAGCSKSYHPETWVANWDDSKSLPGVTSGTVEYFDFDQGGPHTCRFVVWSDLPTSKAMSSSGAMGTKYFSDHTDAQGKKLHVESSSSHLEPGVVGIVSVDGQQCLLNAGRVILISTQGVKPEILQLDLPETSEIWKIVKQTGGDSDPQTELSIFARSTPEILKFFKSHTQQPGTSGELKTEPATPTATN